MTIESGTVVKAESASELLEELSISAEELFGVLTDDEKERVVSDYNSVCDDWDGDTVDSVDELPDFVYDEWREWIPFRHPETLVLDVMEDRDTRYVHIQEDGGFGSSSFHTVVELNE